MDIILTDKEKIILVVPGKILSGELVLKVMNDSVLIMADGHDFVDVKDIDKNFTMQLAKQEEVPLIEFIDKEGKEITEFKITHTAKIKDCR